MKKRARRVLLVTYNGLPGILSGRSMVGNVLIYTGKNDLPPFTITTANPELIGLAETTLASFRSQLFLDLKNIEDVYVYVGNVARDAAMKFIEELVALGKKVRMIACDCHKAENQKFEHFLSVPWIVSDCSGCETCRDLIRKCK